MRRLLPLTFLFIFLSLAARSQVKYWVAPGVSGNWSTAANWSASSGGAGGAGAPTSLQDAVFDGGSTADVILNTSFIQLRDFTIQAGYTKNIIQPLGSNILLVNRNFNTSNGTFTAAGTVIINGTYIQNGGVFNSAAAGGTITGVTTINAGTFNVNGPLQFDGNLNLNSVAATLNGGTSTVTFNGSTATTINVDGAVAGNITFYDVILDKGNPGTQTLTISAGDHLIITRDLTLTAGLLGGGSGIVEVGRNLFINNGFLGAAVDLVLIGPDNALITVNAPFTTSSAGITTVNKTGSNNTVSFVTDLGSNLINFNTQLTNTININNGTLNFPDNDNVNWNYANFNIGTGGVVDATSGTTTIQGNFTNSGLFMANGGTVAFQTANTRTYSVGGPGINGSTKFNNVILNNTSAGGSNNIQLGDTLIVQGDLNIIDGRFVTPGGSVATPGFLQVNGNLTTAAASNASNVSIELIFGGSTASIVTLASGTEAYWNGTISIKKSAGAITLASPFTLDQANQIINFSNGIIYTSATNILTIGTTTVANGANSNSYADGPVRKLGNRVFSFPIGTAGVYAPARISGATINTNLSAASEYIAQYFRADPTLAFSPTVTPPLTNVSLIEYWQINKVTGADAFVWLSYDDTRSQGVTSTADLRVANYVSAGANWVERGNKIGALTETYVGTNAVQTNYPVFTLASINAILNPLPVTWLEFTGRQKGSSVELAWSTVSEKNNEKFSIERSANGTDFTEIGTVAGNGTTNLTSYYTFTDKNPLKSTSTYRIKQIDLNGKFSYSKEVRLTGADVAITGVRLYPNPVNASIPTYIENYNWRNQKVQITIISSIGTVVRNEQINFGGDGRSKINVSGLLKGTYFITSVFNGQKNVVPFVIQ